MNKEYFISKHANNKPLTVIDDVVILGRDVDEENHTVYIIEKDGKKDVVLYNQIDQTKLPKTKKDFEEVDMVISKRTPTGSESIKLKNYDEHGNHVPIDMELERDKFINPHKYGKNNKA